MDCTTGRVAQLGEHLLCKQGVRGSNPLTSTKFPYKLIFWRAVRQGQAFHFTVVLPFGDRFTDVEATEREQVRLFLFEIGSN
jgi:hypothetical protein